MVFVDTAGLREAGDEIEEEGIRRSRASLAKAELVLHVLDVSEPLSPLDVKFLAESAGKKRILVRNKIDLPARLEVKEPTVGVSCVTGKGLESLKDAIKGLVWSGEIKSEMLQVMINSRHQGRLETCPRGDDHHDRRLTRRPQFGVGRDGIAYCRKRRREIIGKTSTEDLLDSIFSQFCIGK